MSASARAAERLRNTREELATAITEALYAADPTLYERYGEVGRVRCHEDIRFNLEHLTPAVELQEPAMFSRYVRWLDDLLSARNVSSEDVARSLREMERVIRDGFPEDEAEAVAPSIRAGLAELGTTSATP
jgi:MerR family transcriptional regulator, light-induced transcriptional regulator